jgi:glucuronate isomerase
MPTLTETLYAEISRIPAIDIHTHLRALQPSAASLRQLLGYHYFTELAHSAGLPKAALADDLPDDRMVPALVAAMARFNNTVQYGWFMDLAHTLLDFKDRHLTVDNWPALAATAASRFASKGWTTEVLRRGSIEKVFLTNSINESLEGFDRETFVPCLRCDDLVFGLARQEVRDSLAQRGGRTVTDTKTLRIALTGTFAYFAACQARSAAISLPPDFTCRPVSDATAEPLLAAVLRGEALTPDEQAQLSTCLFYLVAENCRTFRLPLQLMIGVIRGACQHGVPMGQDLLSNRGSLTQYLDLFNRFPDVTFTVSVLSPTMVHELLAFTWIFQNVRASGHWWYANVPGLIEDDLRSRLEALPQTKLLGYYSDVYYIEFAPPKFAMYRWCLARVLTGQIEMKRLTEAEALAVAARLLRDNAKEIFGV